MVHDVDRLVAVHGIITGSATNREDKIVVKIKVTLYAEDLGFEIERKFFGKDVPDAQKRLAEYLEKHPTQRFVRQVTV